MKTLVILLIALTTLAGSAAAGANVSAEVTLPTREAHRIDAYADETAPGAGASVDGKPVEDAVGAPEVPALPADPTSLLPALPSDPTTLLPAAPSVPSDPTLPGDPTGLLPAVPSVPAAPELPDAPDVPSSPVGPGDPTRFLPTPPSDPSGLVPEAPAMPEAPAEEDVHVILDEATSRIEGLLPL